MASWSQRLLSLAMVFALSGSPAVLAACMALCLQGGETVASHEHSHPEGHAIQLPAASPAVASTHAHHGSPASNSPAATATKTGSSHRSSNARSSADCTNCCRDGQVATVARLGVQRTDATSLGAAAIASEVAPFLLTAPGFAASPPGPPAPPPWPARARLVLRI